MIISYILSKIKNKEKRENLVFGLVFGLAGGLAGGLVFGLVFGLAGGLVFGLAFGLAGGLVFGLAGGLTNHSQLLEGLFPIWILAVSIILISEVFFILDKGKPKDKENTFTFTLKKKAENLIESSIIIVNLLNLNYVIKYVDLSPYFIYVGYLGLGIIILAIGYGWIKVNEMKYK